MNIRSGGGLTHLASLLSAADPTAHGFSRVVVWSAPATLNAIEPRPWLEKATQLAGGPSVARWVMWQAHGLSAAARAAGCDLLYVPGSTYVGGFRPFVSCSQNLLPFEAVERQRYGWSKMELTRFGGALLSV